MGYVYVGLETHVANFFLIISFINFLLNSNVDGKSIGGKSKINNFKSIRLRNQFKTIENESVYRNLSYIKLIEMRTTYQVDF